jgi:hypothetical protein
MPNPLDPKTPVNRAHHPEWFDHVRNSGPRAIVSDHGTEKIVEPVNVDQVKIAQPLPAKRKQTGIHCGGAIGESRAKINHFDAVQINVA